MLSVAVGEMRFNYNFVILTRVINVVLRSHSRIPSSLLG